MQQKETPKSRDLTDISDAPVAGRIVAIDPGTKRIGVAVCDEFVLRDQRQGFRSVGPLGQHVGEVEDPQRVDDYRVAVEDRVADLALQGPSDVGDVAAAAVSPGRSRC